MGSILTGCFVQLVTKHGGRIGTLKIFVDGKICGVESFAFLINTANFRLKGVGITPRELKGANFITTPKEYERHTRGLFEFKTPSRKVELYSTLFEKYGYDPLPHYKNPPEVTSEYPLILMGGKKRVEFVHSAGRQIAMLRRQVPEPTVEINPKTAKARGIADGDWVWLETFFFGDKDRVRFKAKIVEGFPNDVVAVEHGWWFPEIKDPMHACFDSNVNVVLSGDLYDPIYGSTHIKSVPCRIYKVNMAHGNRRNPDFG
jgi:anaerobic selenocysteine-containing dehydrogenase